MKTVLLSFVIVALVTVLLTKPASTYDFTQAWKYLYEAATAASVELRAENRELQAIADTVPLLKETLAVATNQLREQNESIGELETELFEARIIVSLVSNVSNLQAQSAALFAQISDLSGIVGQQRNELGRLLTAVASINTMVDALPALNYIGCRQFPGRDGYMSMAPAFTDSSLVCISDEPAYLATAAVGDIVIAWCSNYSVSVIHRIVAEFPYGWQLKGDFNNSPDPCIVPKNTVTWKVAGIAHGVFWQ